MPSTQTRTALRNQTPSEIPPLRFGDWSQCCLPIHPMQKSELDGTTLASPWMFVLEVTGLFTQENCSVRAFLLLVTD